MTFRENILTVSIGSSVEEYPIISRSKDCGYYEYFLFDKYKIYKKRINKDRQERRQRRREFNRLNKQKLFIEDYISSDYKTNKENVLLITVSFNNPIIIDYQIKLIDKYLEGNYLHIICDNSNKNDAALEIKEVCKKYNRTYIRVKNTVLPNGYSDSHGIALNWIWENIIKSKQKNFGLLDHDIFPIKKQNVEYYLKNQDFWGVIRFKNKKNHKDIWSLWPGFAFYRYNAVSDKKLNFRRYKLGGFIKVRCVDTGSANWKQLYSKYNADKINGCDVITWDLNQDKEFTPNGNKNSDFEECAEYINNKTWLHSINGSEWHESCGKLNLVYKKLNMFLEDNAIV